MKYKLYLTDNKTYFHFRSNPDSLCEAFTVSYLIDGTVVLSGDYGTLTWKREGHSFNNEKDYGFPYDDTNLNYFAEKVSICSGGRQKIQEFNSENAKKQIIKELFNQGKGRDSKKIKEDLYYTDFYSESDCIKYCQEKLDWSDCWEWNLGIDYTSQFKFQLKILQEVSKVIQNAFTSDTNKENK